MTFAKIVFTAAGLWGIVVLMPLYFLLDVTGRHYAPPATYPQFFYGFLSVAMAWQIAFLIIGSLLNALIAFLYNFAADKVGGVELTFVEKDV